MSRLARSLPGYDGLTVNENSSVLDDVQVNQWNLQANSIYAKHITPNSIDTSHLTVGLAFPVTIEDGSVTARKLAAGSVTTDKIAAFAVTANELDTSSVTSDKIGAYQVTAGKMYVTDLANISTLFTGAITISSQSGGASPNTGVYITNNIFQMTTAGVAKVQLNASAGTYLFNGDITCTRITVTSNPSNSVVFGSDITVEGNIIMTASPVSKYIYFGGGSSVFLTGSSSMATLASSQQTIVISQYGTKNARIACYTPQTGAGSISIGYPFAATNTTLLLGFGADAASSFTLYRGTTSVMSMVGTSNNVTFAGAISSGAITSSGLVTCANLRSTGSDGVWGIHKSRTGVYKTNTSFTFYAASTSGGSPTHLHTVTFVDGIITAWSAT